MLAGRSSASCASASRPSRCCCAERKLLRDSLAIGVGVLLAGAVLLALGTAWLSRGFDAACRWPAGASPRATTARRLPRSRVREIDGVAQAFNQMATAVQAQMAELKEREQSLRHVFDTLSEGLILQDRDRQVLDCNEALLRLYGIDARRVHGPMPALARLRVLWPDGREMRRRAARRVAQRTGQPQRDRVCQLVRRDGRRCGSASTPRR